VGFIDRIAGSESFLRIAPKFVPKLDRAVHRLTRGKVMLSDRKVPALILHTTGAKSGQPRETPLASMPDGDGWYVVGSNFGQEKHPAWSTNLLAHPDAAVTVKGRRVEVRARLLDADEKRAVWPRLLEVWPNYDRYVERSGGRDLRVFRLDPR
jgi:deazaflavin-dependent oxidoreductase (nitroreductase family)